MSIAGDGVMGFRSVGGNWRAGRAFELIAGFETSVTRMFGTPAASRIGAVRCRNAGPVRLRVASDSGKVSRHQGRVGPVEQPGGKAVVLGGNEHLPLVHRWLSKVRPRIADEIPQDVFLEVGLAVR